MAQQQTVQQETKEHELKIVLIGASKAGKSATGNTVLGRKAFKSLISDSSVTQECKIEYVELGGQNLAVVDTPCLFGSTTSDSFDEEISEQVLEELKLLLPDSPIPVVFLVVLQLGRFTKQEQQIVGIIQRSLGREAVHYTMALFTRGDDLKKEGCSIEELIGANQALRDFIRECRGGFHVFDNGDADLPQVTELLQKINSIVERNGESNNKMSQEDERVLQRQKFGRKATGRGNTCGMFLLEGAFDGGCTTAVILSLMDRHRFLRMKDILYLGAVGGVIGAFIGAARFVVHRLRWGNK